MYAAKIMATLASASVSQGNICFVSKSIPVKVLVSKVRKR